MGKANDAAEKNRRQTNTFRELRQSMLDDLTTGELVDRAYTDKVEEYMDFWGPRQELEADIAARGVTVLDAKREMPVEDRSVFQSVRAPSLPRTGKEGNRGQTKRHRREELAADQGLS